MQISQLMWARLDVSLRPDPTYQPAQAATRNAAPSASWARQIHHPRIRRAIHSLSRTEASLAQILICAPQVFDIFEQVEIPAFAAQHPLDTHPGAPVALRPAMVGTLEAAQRLGALRQHPARFCDAEKKWKPIALRGDFLVFLNDVPGGRCVNVSVKKTARDFSVARFKAPRSLAQAERLNEQAVIRHAIERDAYQSAGIPTVRFTGEDVDNALATNLEVIIGAANQRLAQTLRSAEQFICSEIARGAIPNLIAQQVARELCLPIQNVRLGMYELIYEYALDVDLFRPLAFDKPWPPAYQTLKDYAYEWLAPVVAP